MKWFAFTAVVAALVVLYCGGAAVAAEEENAVTVTGKVSVVKAEDNVTAITVSNEQATYSIVLDKNGKALAAMDGKMVQVTGTVTQTEDGKKLLKVTSVKPVVEEHKAE